MFGSVTYNITIPRHGGTSIRDYSSAASTASSHSTSSASSGGFVPDVSFFGMPLSNLIIIILVIVIIYLLVTRPKADKKSSKKDAFEGKGSSKKHMSRAEKRAAEQEKWG